MTQPGFGDGWIVLKSIARISCLALDDSAITALCCELIVYRYLNSISTVCSLVFCEVIGVVPMASKVYKGGVTIE